MPDVEFQSHTSSKLALTSSTHVTGGSLQPHPEVCNAAATIVRFETVAIHKIVRSTLNSGHDLGYTRP
jgi:hypothetical protein